MKYGKKHFIVDENKRDTYRQFDPMSLSDNSPILYHSNGNMKRLVPVYFCRNMEIFISCPLIMCTQFQVPFSCYVVIPSSGFGRNLKKCYLFGAFNFFYIP